MRGTNRKRALIVSGSVILLCLTLIVGMTWALFTDTQTVTNHLQAGDLDITLERIALSKTTLTPKGYLNTTDYTGSDAYEDFTNTTDANKNVFGLGQDELIVPGSKFVSTMKITNNSDAAFKYWIDIKIDVEGLTPDEIAALKLDEQLIITVYTDKDGDGVIDTDDSDGTVESDASVITTGLTVGGKDDPIGTLEIVGDGNHYTETFIVSVEFDDKGYTYEDGVLDSDNNVSKMQNVKFDLVVYAVQVTEAP